MWRSLAALLLLLPVAACTSTAPRTAQLSTSGAPVGQSGTARRTEADRPYDGLIAYYAAENGVPLPLAHAVVKLESGYNPKARGGGAVGLMQIKPATARGIGYQGPTAGLYDPETNLQWGMKYLGGAYKLGGGETCATALRYQGGHRATRMSASTRQYCAKLKAFMGRETHAERDKAGSGAKAPGEARDARATGRARS